ncbi:MAG: hypothetical protein AAFO84_11740, partial [Cyanobacteria bacterium J06598_1]
DQISKVLEGKVSTVHEVTDRAENLAYSLGVSVSTLHVRGAETPGTYQELTRQLFESHPSYVLGMGFGQKEGGILTDRDWFYPYYQIDSQIDSQDDSQAGAQLGSSTAPLQTTAQSDSVRYVDRAETPTAYFDSEAYRTYFLPQKSVWTAPYQSDDISATGTAITDAATEDDSTTLLTYYSQIFDDQQTWLGTAVIDVDGAYFQAILDEPVFRQGGQLFLLANNGEVIADPAAEGSSVGLTYTDIAGLSEIWPEIKGESSQGLLEGEAGYWSYIQIPEQSWVVLAYVPYRVVFGQIVGISLGAMLLAGLLMAGLTALAIRYLNRRLRPVIDECERLSLAADLATDAPAPMTNRLVGKDELEQLSISFFHLLEQLQLSQTQVKLEAAHATEVEAQLSQIKTRTAVSRQRQRQVTQKLANLLPNAAVPSALTGASSTSARGLQYELSQLNAVVETLAEDDWLSGTLIDRTEGAFTASEMPELHQISRQLGQTFAQVLAALNQFSQLLGTLGDTNAHGVRLEQEMTAAQQAIGKQLDALNQLQQWAGEHDAFCHELILPEGDAGAESVQQQKLRSQAQKESFEPAVTMFRETTGQLSEQLKSLFSVTESIDKKYRQYQRINSAAQVLLMNASTLSISASRQQDAAAFEGIVEQLKAKKAELEGLAKQLEATHVQQQEDALQIGRLTADLRLNVGVFEQVTKQMDSQMNSLMDTTAVPATASSKYNKRLAEQRQQLQQQLDVLRERLQEMDKMTQLTAEHVSATLQETVQMNQVRAKFPMALPSS